MERLGKAQGNYASEKELVIADDALKHLFGGHPGDHERLFPVHQYGEDVGWKYCPVKDREPIRQLSSSMISW